MASSNLRRAAVVLAAALPLAAGGFALGQRYPTNGYRLFQSVLQLVSEEAVDSLGPDSLYITASRGLIDALGDPYAELFNQRDFERFNRNQLGNRYGGIGLRIVHIRGGIQVWRVIPGGPAEAAGVQRGDRIVQVGDSSTDGWTTDRTANNLTGVPGTPVNVTFERRDGARFTRDLTRAVISVSVVPFVTVLDGGVGYLPVQRFSDRSATDVAGALRDLQAAGATSILMDLRGNPGGSLDQAVQMGNLFLDAGRPIVRVLARRSDDTLRGTRPPLLPPRMPLALLVDSSSASASEIVAGALQDFDRALIVGTNTFGKGLVQGAYNLPDGWVAKLTTGHWYTPLGRPLQRSRAADSLHTPRPVFRSAGGRAILGGGGVTPDVIVYHDTLATMAQSLLRLLNTRAAAVNDVLDGYAAELDHTVDARFTVPPAWRAELIRRLRGAGLLLPDTLDAAAGAQLDRILEGRIVGFALSDSTAFLRGAPRDIQLNRAAALLRGRHTQQDLLAAAPATVPN